jgi:hypothetical protein
MLLASACPAGIASPTPPQPEHALSDEASILTGAETASAFETKRMKEADNA